METVEEIPIVGVCIVSDPIKIPPNYLLIDKTHDKSEDADMWKDGFFGRRVMRYLCVQRQIPTNTDDVLVDVTLINERDEPPPGFTVLDTTHDSNEKASKKRLVCLRWMVPSMTKDAITELVLINRTQRRAPVGYTMVGDINNLALCYKMGRVPSSSSNNRSQSDGSQGLPYNVPGGASSGLPYAPPVPSRVQGPGLGIDTAAARGGLHQGPISPPINNPLSGIQWKMNSRFELLMGLQKLTIPEIQGKTLSELERQYEYTFELESSVSKTAFAS